MDRFRIDGASRLLLAGRSTLHRIEGRADRLHGEVLAAVADGHILLDPPPRGWVEVDLSSLRSGNPLVDGEVQRRIDAAAYPSARFELDTVDGGLAAVEDGAQAFRITGRLLVRDTTLPVRATVTVRLDGEVLRVTGSDRIDVRRFGVTPPRFLGMRVDPVFTVTVEVVAVRTADAQPTG